MHLKYLKNILGLNRGAVNSAVLSELGRYPLLISSLKLMIGFWCHITNKHTNDLVNKAYQANIKLENGFCQKLEFFIKDLGFSHIWENQSTFSKRCLVNSVGKKLQERYIRYWKRIFDESSDVYCSKLRTYKDLKHTYNIEQYLLLDIEKLHTKNYLKLRISNSRLMIEQGRHKQLEINKRICPKCSQEIETEFHFIMSCPTFNNHRENLFNTIHAILYRLYDISKILVTSVSNMYNERVTSPK